jgi:NADH-quinone oxidoreductase subunit M
MTFPWLTFLGLLPIIGGLLLFLPMGKGAARILGLVFSVATLAVGVTVAVLHGTGADLSVAVPWIRAFGAWWALGVDGMGLAMILLTVVLTPLVLLAEWEPPAGRWSAQSFFALVLILEGLALFVFMAPTDVLFYLFFEATLIPTYFLIGGFGGERRGQAAMKFLLYSAWPAVWSCSPRSSACSPSPRAGDAVLPHRRPCCAPNIDGDLGRWLCSASSSPSRSRRPWCRCTPGCRTRPSPVHAGHGNAARRRPGQDRHLRHDPVLPGVVPGGITCGNPVHDWCSR